MYDDLVKRLRTMADWAGISFLDESENVRYNLSEAADAIEELDLQLDRIAAENEALCETVERMRNPRWIPVTGRLPGREWVLCKCRANIHEVLSLRDGYWYHDPQHQYMSGFVTHWQPIPEPPKEKT